MDYPVPWRFPTKPNFHGLFAALGNLIFKGSPMRLIAGCGYLGRRVAKLWLDQGIAVAALTRTEVGALALHSLGIQPILGDVTDPKSLLQIAEFGPFEGLFHAVGLDRSSGKSMNEVYVQGLVNLLDNLPLARCPKMVFVSSTSVYAQTDGSWINETTKPNAVSGSGGTANLAETVLHQHRPSAVILRFAGIYGPGRLLRSKAIEGGDPIPVDPEKWLNLIHVDDGARAVDLAWNKAASGMTLHLADGNPVLRGDYYRTLAKLLGAPAPSFAAGIPGTRGGPDASHRRIDSGFAKEVLGWQPYYPTYESGLQGILAEEKAAYPNTGSIAIS